MLTVDWRIASRVEGNISIGQVICDYLSRDRRRVALAEVFASRDKQYCESEERNSVAT